MSFNPMNYPYREFLREARDACISSINDARKTTDAIGITFSLDENFPWKDGFQKTVGRCGSSQTEEEDFCISIHYRAIYHSIKSCMNLPWYTKANWEMEIVSAIRTTVLHEVAHGIYRYFLDITTEDDDMWDWCIEKSFNEMLFISECEDIEYEEAIVEEYARYEDSSKLGQFISAFLTEYCQIQS